MQFKVQLEILVLGFSPCRYEITRLQIEADLLKC